MGRGNRKIEKINTEETGITVSGLTSGSYKLQETQAPDGYIITNSTVDFSVNATGTGTVINWGNGEKPANVKEPSQTSAEGDIITIINTPGASLPNTGGSGTSPYTWGGLALLLGSAMM